MSPKKLEKLYEEFATDDLSIEELREFESFHKKQEYGDSLMIESELSNLDSPKVFKDGWRTIYYDFSDETHSKVKKKLIAILSFQIKFRGNMSLRSLV